MSENQSEGNGKKSFKDVKNSDDLDFSKIELIRGQTPEDIKEKCLQFCKEYLSGNWSQQTVDTIEVRRITGGLMNQLYYCAILEPNADHDVPQEVAVRLYGKNIFEYCDSGRITDLVVSLVFSEQKLGPKLYGVFEAGRIQKFYKHRQFKEEEQKNPELVKNVFKTLARIHSLEVPIKKDPLWFHQLLVKCYEISIDKFPINQLFDENNCQTLKQNDLKTEINWIKGVIQNANSPVLFTHNDYRSSNLLITEPNDELVVCDYDIAGYGYRGYEFISIMKEWGRKQFEKIILNDNLPIEDDVCKPLIAIYVEECQRIHGKSYSENPINSVEHILKEVKIFLLFSYLFHCVFCLKLDEKEDEFPLNKKLCMEFAEKAFKDYFIVKKILIEQKIITN